MHVGGLLCILSGSFGFERKNDKSLGWGTEDLRDGGCGGEKYMVFPTTDDPHQGKRTAGGLIGDGNSRGDVLKGGGKVRGTRERENEG